MKSIIAAVLLSIVPQFAQASGAENYRCCPSTASPLMVDRNACAQPNNRTDLILKVTAGSLAKNLKKGEQGVFDASPASKNDFSPYT
ncbi:MAG: hypothetical protein EOP09_04995, partial [Proteobacteria bacterium]